MSMMEKDTKWKNLQALKHLHSQGFITKTEYRQRLKQLIDELTGTTISTPSATQLSTQRMQREMSIDSAILARPPPSFEGIEREQATKWSYDLKKGKWTSERICVQLDSTPFARGSLRVAYHMKICAEDEAEVPGAKPHRTPPLTDSHTATTSANSNTTEVKSPTHWDANANDSGSVFSEVEASIIDAGDRRGARRWKHRLSSDSGDLGTVTSIGSTESKNLAGKGLAVPGDTELKDASYVAKISLRVEDTDNREVYFRDVEMQCLAGYIATRFNQCKPPKKVQFLEAFVVELEEREGRPICGVERYIRGPYRKHNSNYGYVSEDERNTPQAFSHFSWHISQGEVLVVDLQGVSDLYTDPQVHSVSGKGYGKGNLGMKGIRKFLENHRCNRICQYLRLPRCNDCLRASPMHLNAEGRPTGTLPLTKYMQHNIKILTYDPRDLENKPLTSGLPILPGSPERPSPSSEMSKTRCNCVIV